MKTATLILMLLCPILLCGQNTTRGKLKLRAKTEAVAIDSTDTTISAIRISGYEKAQSSQNESMFVTNNGRCPICGINITITYTDMHSQQLHRHTETVSCEIPVGETHNISLKSWDKQRLWYYKGTQARHTDYSTPFDVTVKVNYVIVNDAQ